MLICSSQQSAFLPVYPEFNNLPLEVQERTLMLIRDVNQRHLHCNDYGTWQKVHYHITKEYVIDYIAKQNKKQAKGTPATPIAIQSDAERDKDVQTSRVRILSQKNREGIRQNLIRVLCQIFHHLEFVDNIFDAFQEHILDPLENNSALVILLYRWVENNVMYLPLGTHLLEPYQSDMMGISPFYQHVLAPLKLPLIPEALSKTTLQQMKAFLSKVAQAHCKTCGPIPPQNDQPTAVILSVKNGAGGHTAPSQAMAAHLKERNWKVITLHYDTDLDETDPCAMLGITFEDGSPLTHHLIQTRWIEQKQNLKVARIVNAYIAARITLTTDLFHNNSGGNLLLKQIIPLNPQLIVTTLAYHWIWKSLAYRVVGAKTLLVASDVFFHREAFIPWYRQLSLPEHLRQIYFTTMTDDLELLHSFAVHHDDYFIRKYPHYPLTSMLPLVSGLQHLDSQISVIGAPIHPAFDAVTDLAEIDRLKVKWGIPEGAVSVCISRGKLGYTSDFIPALESYRTDETLSQPLIINIVCGENTAFYESLLVGAFSDLGPNITLKPYPLLPPKDFAEIRSISMVDDIKAGGGSTFEGWYLISKGAFRSMLLLTPGTKLWWEKSNCEAMTKWGIGRTVAPDTKKIAIIQEIMANGLPEITHSFPDWKGPFDQLVDRITNLRGE